MLINATDLALFTVASLSLNLTPGNDMMFVLGQAMRSGTRTGIAASLGIATGSLFHLGLVALGVAVILAQHPAVFDAVRYAGAAYLLWMAWKALTTPVTLTVAHASAASAFRAWRDGTLVNVFNPKIVVFMFAFLPPFIHAENGSPLLQLFILGMIFNIGGTLINIAVAVFAGRIRALLSGSARLAKWFSRTSAFLFLLLAARLSLSAR